MEEYTPEEQPQEEKYADVKRWFQDNLRIIISVIIVIFIAGGIYSYSKRGESPIVTDNSSSIGENAASDQTATDNSKTATDQTATNETTLKKQQFLLLQQAVKLRVRLLKLQAKATGQPFLLAEHLLIISKRTLIQP